MKPPRPDDIQYALETTEVLYEPARRIDTFGSTRFDYRLVSEPMDQVGQVRVRSGSVEAEKPQLIRPEGMESFEFEGFSERAREFFDAMKEKGLDPAQMAVVRYGFHMKRTEAREELLTDSLENVCDRVVADIRDSGDPMTAVIRGVDDTWEFSIMRFMIEMMGKSAEINHFDFQRRGMM